MRGDQIYAHRELLNLQGIYEHHGIDCGDGSVIHYRKPSETIEQTSIEILLEEIQFISDNMKLDFISLRMSLLVAPKVVWANRNIIYFLTIVSILRLGAKQGLVIAYKSETLFR